MTAAPRDLEFEDIECCHHGTRFNGKGTDGHTRYIVHTEDRLHRILIEQAGLDHRPTATFIFFCRLENKVNRTFEVARFGQVSGGAQEHGGVPIMTASVHFTGVGRNMVKGVLLNDG